MRYITIILLFVSTWVFGQNYTSFHVDSAGDNSNSGISEALAWKTLQYAMTHDSLLTLPNWDPANDRPIINGISVENEKGTIEGNDNNPNE